MNELENIKENTITKQNILDYLLTSETKLSPKQQEMFVHLALMHQLNPFKREIYAIAYGKEFSIVTGYQTYIERAERGGNLDGWHCENTQNGARITIYRKDWKEPFVWEASYDEFDKEHGSWLKMRKFMIKKVCIGQGFRLAFPTELGGMLYTQEEMEGAKPFASKPEVQKTQKKETDGTSKTELIVRTIVGETTSQSGTSKTGKPYTKHMIHTPDGDFSTFSDTIAGQAIEAHGEGRTIDIYYEKTKFGNNIIKIMECLPEDDI